MNDQSARPAGGLGADQHLRAVLDSLGEGVVVQDIRGRVLFLNTKAADILGVSGAEAGGRTSKQLGWSALDESGRPLAAEDHPGFASLRSGQPVEGVIVQHVPASGANRWLELSSYPLVEGDVPDAVVTVIRDVTDRRADAESLRMQARVLESVGQAIIVVGLDRCILYWNRAAEQIYGWSAAEVLGRDVLEVTTYEDQATHAAEVADAIERGESWTGDFWSRRRDGTRFPVLVTDTPVFDDDGELVSVIGLSTDISARVEAEVAFAHQALHDSLTGLANRSLLEARLLAVADDGPSGGALVVVLAIGIDQLAVVNEELGRDAGDDLLVEVAHRLVAAMEPADTVARLAADEFVVVCHRPTPSSDPLRLARTIESVMEPPVVIHGRKVFVTVSIGAVEVDLTSDPLHAVREATDAMAQAKERGRAQIFIPEASVARPAPTNRLDTASALRHAIPGNELRLHYQPVIDLESMRISGFEALVRWQHPERGLLLPGEFIDLAEDTGLIVGIGGWVLNEAIRQIAEWRSGAAGDLSIAVNISARQLRTADILVDLRDHLDRDDVPPHAVHLEITESVLMDDVEHSIESLVALKSIGVQVDVDDFGTGYSSLSYLKRLPIDGLKIDQSFVDGLGRDENDSAITRAIVSLGRALNLNVIAEGVETVAQAREVSVLGCQAGQGYLWSPAVPPAEAAVLLTGRPVAAIEAES